MIEPSIQTARLDLSAFRDGDVAAFFAYRRLPDVCRFQSFEPVDISSARRFIDGVSGVVFGTLGTWYQLALRMRSDGALVGDVGLHFVADSPGTVEIGVTLAPDHQRTWQPSMSSSVPRNASASTPGWVARPPPARVGWA